MMAQKEWMELGTTPANEDCVQVSKEDYLPAMTKECERYKEMLINRYPVPAGVNAYFGIKTFPHDFGSYKEVCIIYDAGDERSANFALFVEGSLPQEWDDTGVMVCPEDRLTGEEGMAEE